MKKSYNITPAFFIMTILFLLPNSSYADIPNELYGKGTKISYPTQEPMLTNTEQELFSKIQQKLCQSIWGKKLLTEAENIEYRFGFSTSTYTVHRTVYIKKDSDQNNAVLDFTYELSNAIHYQEYFELNLKAIRDEISQDEFVKRNLELEACAVYWQYLIAKDLNLLYLSFYKQPCQFALNLDHKLPLADKLWIIKSKLQTLAGTSEMSISLSNYYKQQYNELKATSHVN